MPKVKNLQNAYIYIQYAGIHLTWHNVVRYYLSFVPDPILSEHIIVQKPLCPPLLNRRTSRRKRD